MPADSPAPSPSAPSYPIVDLVGAERDRAILPLKEGFTGIYRWHAKRTLRTIETVRAVELDGAIAGAALTERLDAEVGYVYYLFVGAAFRRRGIAAALLDDALDRFRRAHVAAVFAASEAENRPSIALFRSRGFREVHDDEPRVRDGGLGAWGYRSRMLVVHGERLFGRRLDRTTEAGHPADVGPRRPTR